MEGHINPHFSYKLCFNGIKLGTAIYYSENPVLKANKTWNLNPPKIWAFVKNIRKIEKSIRYYRGFHICGRFVIRTRKHWYDAQNYTLHLQNNVFSVT